MLPATCDTVHLGRDGSFTWRAQSDVTERDESGRWSFESHDADSGILFFSTGSSVLFKRVAADLQTTRVPLVPVSGGAPGPAAEIAPVAPPHLYATLLGTCWKKTNDFDLHRRYENLVFGTDGAFDASYRGGQCRHGGVFAVDEGDLVVWPDANACDLRATAATSRPTKEQVLLSRDRLTLYDATYWPEAFEAHDKLFVADSWWLQPGKPFQPDGASDWGSARITGRYAGSLQQGEPTNVTITVQNLTSIGIKVGALTATTQLLSLEPNGFRTMGDTLVAAEHDYQERHLLPGEMLTDQVSCVPTVAGDYVRLNVKLPFTFFSGGDSTNDTVFVVPVLPGHPPDAHPPDDGRRIFDGPEPPPYQPCGALTGGTGELQSVAISPDATLLAAGDGNAAKGAVHVWRLSRNGSTVTGEPIIEIPGAAPFHVVYGVQFAMAKEGVLASTQRKSVRLWSLTDGSPVGSLDGHANDVLTLAASADGQQLASGSIPDGQVKVWRVTDQSAVRTIDTGQGTIFALAFAPDGTLASGGKDGSVKLWDLSSGALVRTLVEHTNSVSAVSFLQGGSVLVSGGFDNSVLVWNATDGALRNRVKTTASVVDMAVSPDGVVAVTDNGVALYNIEGGGPRRLEVPDASASISRSVAFSADGSILASADYDGQVHLWCR
jgi:WD40 repeat protein